MAILLTLLLALLSLSPAFAIEVVNESSAALGSVGAEIRMITYGPELVVSGRGPGTTRQLEVIIVDAAGSTLWATSTETTKLFDVRIHVQPAGVLDGARIAKVIIRDQTPENVAAREREMPEILRRIKTEEAAKEAETRRRREEEQAARAAATKVGPDPESFRGVPWGATQDDLYNHLVMNGDQVTCYPKQFCTSSGVKIGPVVARASYIFHDGRFTGALLTFKPADYPTLKAIFVERYGRPTAEGDEPYQTQGGTRTTNPVTRWTGNKVVIRISGYGSRIDEGSATIVLREELERTTKEKEKAIQKGKGDL